MLYSARRLTVLAPCRREAPVRPRTRYSPLIVSMLRPCVQTVAMAELNQSDGASSSRGVLR